MIVSLIAVLSNEISVHNNFQSFYISSPFQCCTCSFKYIHIWTKSSCQCYGNIGHLKNISAIIDDDVLNEIDDVLKHSDDDDDYADYGEEEDNERDEF